MEPNSTQRIVEFLSIHGRNIHIHPGMDFSPSHFVAGYLDNEDFNHGLKDTVYIFRGSGPGVPYHQPNKGLLQDDDVNHKYKSKLEVLQRAHEMFKWPRSCCSAHNDVPTFILRDGICHGLEIMSRDYLLQDMLAVLKNYFYDLSETTVLAGTVFMTYASADEFIEVTKTWLESIRSLTHEPLIEERLREIYCMDYIEHKPCFADGTYRNLEFTAQIEHTLRQHYYNFMNEIQSYNKKLTDEALCTIHLNDDESMQRIMLSEFSFELIEKAKLKDANETSEAAPAQEPETN